jgi:glyoxylase-like metal-dependent hydrolase (beta-lactamase superfamily II)
MITLKTFTFNAFAENSFVLSDETGECIIVDAGCDSSSEKAILDEYITNNNLKPVALVNTHGHVDHVVGSRYVTHKYNIPFWCHAEDVPVIATAQKQGEFFGFNIEEPPVVSKYLTENEDIQFGHSSLKVLHVPGHSPGSTALYCKEQKFVIVGDVLFNGSIGRTDLPGGDYDAIMNSIMGKLMKLPDDTIVYPGHGPKTSIHQEALTNPFLGD